jgi:hypothetical protein
MAKHKKSSSIFERVVLELKGIVALLSIGNI